MNYTDEQKAKILEEETTESLKRIEKDEKYYTLNYWLRVNKII